MEARAVAVMVRSAHCSRNGPQRFVEIKRTRYGVDGVGHKSDGTTNMRGAGAVLKTMVLISRNLLATKGMCWKPTTLRSARRGKPPRFAT
jgi:hypothetical protein